MPGLNAPAFIANGNINPSVFVKLDVTAGNNFKVLQAAANTDRIIGISQDSTYQPPGLVGATTVAAAAGQPIQVFGVADVCLLSIGAGGCTAGDYLTSDASGNGVVLTLTDGAVIRFYGAVALETNAANDLGRVVVKIGFGSLT